MKTRPLFSAALLFTLAAYAPAQPPAEVFFSLSRAALPGQSAPVDAVTLDKKDIEAYRPRNPADLLEYTPSVSVRKMNGPFGSAVAAMRGFSSRQTAVMVDDVRLPADLTGTVDLSALPVSGVEKIEILPGGWSPLYGANAEGGVIHLMGAKLMPGARTAQVESALSSYGGRFNCLKAGFAEKNFSAFAAASNDYSGGFQENSEFVKNALTGVFSYGTAETGKLTFRGFESASRTGLPSGTPAPLADWNGKKERRANTPGDYQKTERSMLHAGYEFPASDKLRVGLSAGRGNNIVNARQWGSMTRITLQTRAAGVRFTLKDAVIGADYERGMLASDIYGTHGNGTAAAFAHKVLRPVNDLELVPAARYDHSRRFGPEFSPGLSLVYSPDFAWKFSARAARAFQAPTFADLYDPFVPAADRSPGLRPEISHNYQAGARRNFSSGFYFTLAGYYSAIKDRITLDAARSFAAYNTDSAFNKGLESSLGYDLGGLKVAGAHTCNESKGRLPGGKYLPLAFSPRHRASLTADLKTSRGGLLFKSRYVGKQYTGTAHAGLRIPDYFTADIISSMKFGVVEISVGADNILDRHYAETADTVNGYYPQPGRVWTLSVKTVF